MSLPVPNLDDRSWKQIVDEAVRLIPRYTPEWTNHNPSDPGVTLIELYAWMTEMMIYRLNKVPEKNYLTFLDLIGVRLLPPEPAKVVLELTPAEGADGELVVKKGTQIATQQSGGVDPVTFETERDITLLPMHVVRTVSSARGEVRDHTEALMEEGAREALFAGVSEIERFLYIGDDQLAALNEEAAVDLFFEAMPGSTGPKLPQITEWQYWDGKRWREMAPNRAESGPNRIAFGSHPGIDQAEINQIGTYWVRGKLVEPLKDPKALQLDSVLLRVEILGEGMAPENAFVNIGNYIFLPVDQGKSFHPFGEEPKFDCAMYLGHKELFSAPDARIRIEAQLVDPSVIEAPDPSPDLQIIWEYWNGRKWGELGRTTPMGVSGVQGQHNFLDSTMALSKNGAISFDRPKDLQETEVGGIANLWIRARINSGNYGAPGSYELQGANWVFKEDRPLRPPVLKSMVFKYVREPKNVAHVVSFNDFQFRDHTDDALQPYVYFQPFLPNQDENPAFYLGFAEAFPNKPLSLYFHLDQISEVGDDAFAGGGPRVVWEYWDGERWLDLLPEDGTRGFTRSGYLKFDGPRDSKPREVFGTTANWLRARLESGAYDQPPLLRAVLLNAVDASNGITITEVVGSSDGSADQAMTLASKPILGGAQVFVLEPDEPKADEKKALETLHGFEGTIKQDDDGNGFWVRWQEVENFFESAPTDRHVVIDPIKGELSFGDGRKGQVPPAGRDSIRCEYRIGGGAVGNVGAHTLSILKQSVAFVEKVDNPFSASGGADAETVEEAKKRGSFAIKNRDRAVTSEDYENLAVAASRRVSRAKCVQSQRDGSISLLIVPKAERNDEDARAIPSRDLIDRVAAFIDKRRLITAQVHVGKPRYVDLSLEIAVSLKAGATADRAKADIRDRVKRLLNPLQGGPKSDGWPFGRAVGKADLYPVVESVDGVDRIVDLAIVDEGRRVRVETLKLNEDEMPNLVGIEITDRG